MHRRHVSGDLDSYWTRFWTYARRAWSAVDSLPTNSIHSGSASDEDKLWTYEHRSWLILDLWANDLIILWSTSDDLDGPLWTYEQRTWFILDLWAKNLIHFGHTSDGLDQWWIRWATNLINSEPMATNLQWTVNLINLGPCSDELDALWIYERRTWSILVLGAASLINFGPCRYDLDDKFWIYANLNCSMLDLCVTNSIILRLVTENT